MTDNDKFMYKSWVKEKFWKDKFMPELEPFGDNEVYVFDILGPRARVGTHHGTARWYNVKSNSKGKFVTYRQKRLYFTKWADSPVEAAVKKFKNIPQQAGKLRIKIEVIKHFIRPQHYVDLHLYEGDIGYIIQIQEYGGKQAYMVEFDGLDPFPVYPSSFSELFKIVKED